MPLWKYPVCIQYGEETGWLRMFTAVPGHASGGIMGIMPARQNQLFKKNSFVTQWRATGNFSNGLYDACFFKKGAEKTRQEF